ncbi:MAG: alpha/beta hydrolase [Leptolyngbyaceae cyanobacterium MO_188.B28]|nr:alpha/beta hydrolase [Leptolyngbyaceae cyanobacterium MO_188.B28]
MQTPHVPEPHLDNPAFEQNGEAQANAAAISTRAPLPEAIDNLISNDAVEVFPTCLDQDCLNQLIAERRGILFRPRHIKPDKGLVFYPGGKVDPRAYAPIAQSLAQAGVLVILTPMPDNLAVFGFDRFQDVIADVPEVDRWYLGGHSLGGAMAVRYAVQNPTELTGLILWGSYVTETIDLSQIDLPVASIYGLRDGVATPEEIETGKSFLPSDTLYIPLLGANHAQFGHYGEQEGDQKATISHELQQRLTVSATLYAMDAAEQEVTKECIIASCGLQLAPCTGF